MNIIILFCILCFQPDDKSHSPAHQTRHVLPMLPGESLWKSSTVLKLEPEGQQHSAPASAISQDFQNWLNSARLMVWLETCMPQEASEISAWSVTSMSGALSCCCAALPDTLKRLLSFLCKAQNS